MRVRGRHRQVHANDNSRISPAFEKHRFQIHPLSSLNSRSTRAAYIAYVKFQNGLNGRGVHYPKVSRSHIVNGEVHVGSDEVVMLNIRFVNEFHYDNSFNNHATSNITGIGVIIDNYVSCCRRSQ